jgi:hypothetical protein
MCEQPLEVAVPVAAERDATPPAPASTSPAHVETLLDEALQLTFPASDPIAVSAPPREQDNRVVVSPMP